MLSRKVAPAERHSPRASHTGTHLGTVAPHPAHLLQLQRTIGNQAVGRLLIQCKRPVRTFKQSAGSVESKESKEPVKTADTFDTMSASDYASLRETYDKAVDKGRKLYGDLRSEAPDKKSLIGKLASEFVGPKLRGHAGSRALESGRSAEAATAAERAARLENNYDVDVLRRGDEKYKIDVAYPKKGQLRPLTAEQQKLPEKERAKVKEQKSTYTVLVDLTSGLIEVPASYRRNREEADVEKKTGTTVNFSDILRYAFHRSKAQAADDAGKKSGPGRSRAVESKEPARSAASYGPMTRIETHTVQNAVSQAIAYMAFDSDAHIEEGHSWNPAQDDEALALLSSPNLNSHIHMLRDYMHEAGGRDITDVQVQKGAGFTGIEPDKKGQPVPMFNKLEFVVQLGPPISVTEDTWEHDPNAKEDKDEKPSDAR